jgi:hypothetical protein
MIFQRLFSLSAWETGCTQKSLDFPVYPGNLLKIILIEFALWTYLRLKFATRSYWVRA